MRLRELEEPCAYLPGKSKTARYRNRSCPQYRKVLSFAGGMRG